MNLRDALIQQSPSLALQRAAADRISELEFQVNRLIAYMDANQLWEHYFNWQEGEE